MEFRRRLKAAIELRDMTRADLEALSGVKQNYISMILSGQRDPGLDVAVRLARALEVSLDWLCEIPQQQVGALTPAEDELLRLFRQMSDVGREVALDMARAIAARRSREL